MPKANWKPCPACGVNVVWQSGKCYDLREHWSRKEHLAATGRTKGQRQPSAADGFVAEASAFMGWGKARTAAWLEAHPGVEDIEGLLRERANELAPEEAG